MITGDQLKKKKNLKETKHKQNMYIYYTSNTSSSTSVHKLFNLRTRHEPVL